MRTQSIIGAIVVLALCGCGERARLWDSRLVIEGPHKVAEQAMWIDSTRGQVIAIDPGAGRPRVHSVGIGRNVTFAMPSPSREELMILTGGKEALFKDQKPEQPALTIIRPAAGGAGLERVQTYPLLAAFDRLAVSDDGELAVAYFGPGEPQADGVFRNPNQVALLDLTLPPGEANPTFRTIRSFGSAPSSVVFSPELSIPPPNGARHTLAVISSDDYLTFLDMKHMDRKEITVPLSKPDAASTVIPQEVVFSRSTATVFVRASGAADLFALNLSPKQPADGKDNDFLPTINQPSAGKVVQDLILFADGGRDMILTVNTSQDLALIDADTSEYSIIGVGEPVDTIMAVPSSNPTLALIYSRLTPQSRIHFLELEGLAENLEKNLTSRSLARPVHQLVATPDEQQALVIHNNQRTVVSVLDITGEHHTVSPINGQMALGSFDFTASGSHLVAVTSGLSRLGLLSMSNLLATDLRLDHNPTRVLALGESMVVDHGLPSGMVTVVPAPDAEREDCAVLWGFLLRDLLDQELTD